MSTRINLSNRYIVVWEEKDGVLSFIHRKDVFYLTKALKLYKEKVGPRTEFAYLLDSARGLVIRKRGNIFDGGAQ